MTIFKKYLLTVFITLFFCSPVYSAESKSEKDGVWNTGQDDISHMKGKNSNYKKGRDALKQAKKYDQKKKSGKAKKRFNDAIKFFVLANKENPSQPDILNYLGYSFRKTGDFVMAEIYYEQGLAINPHHIGINEYLGELYVETNRIDKAKERLMILKDCNCEEYEKLNNLISKY
jgi:tetratricopeptide (TPR) repeat protein